MVDKSHLMKSLRRPAALCGSAVAGVMALAAPAAAHPDHSDGFSSLFAAVVHFMTQPDHLAMIIGAGAALALWTRYRKTSK